MKLAPALVLAAALVTAVPAGASTTTEGQLRASDGGGEVDIPLRHTRVTMQVSGFLADVEVEQTFANPLQTKIDATYLFPLPARAAVTAMSITTAGRTVEGSIQTRAEARQTYRLARQQGHVAALLTEERPNLFTQAVANLEPGAEVVVRLRYVEALQLEAGGYELVFPMVAGPRHVPRSSKLSPEEVAALQPPVLPPGRRARHDIELLVDLDAGVPLRGLSSPSHDVVVERLAPARARVSLAAGDTVPDKDFILRYEVAGERPEVALLRHRQPGEPGSFFLVAQPPAAPPAAQIAPRELIFVIDTSSSMAGAPLDKAKALVRRALAELGPHDTFQMVRFDDGASALGARGIASKPQNVALAVAWLDALVAGGGTDMTTGIRAALGFPADRDRLRIVVFITDGYIGNEQEILAQVKAEIGGARLFSFGVGTAVNRYLLEEMAAAGRGAAQVVRPDEDTEPAVRRFAARIAAPVLTDVAIDWGGLEVEEVTPRAIPDLFAGQPLVVAGRYRRGGAATVTVRGRLAGKDVQLALPVTLPDEDASRPAVSSVWARARIGELARAELAGERPEVTAEIIRLALAHHLLTPYTAFVAVDRSRVTKGGEAETVAVPVAVPEGVRREGTGGGGLGLSGSAIGGGGSGYGSIGHGSYGAIATVAPQVMGMRAGGDYSSGIGVEEPPPSDEPAAAPTAAQRASILQCYASARSKQPSLAGRLQLRLEIREGHVVEANVEEAPASAELVACVTKAARGWRFEATVTRRKVAMVLDAGMVKP